MTTKPTTTMTLGEIQGQISAMKCYVENVLGFDYSITCQLYIQPEEKFQLNLTARDKFQQKRDYNEQIGRLGIWEPGDNLDTIFAAAWKQLESHMRRDERELRFGLAQLGDTLEGDQFQTAVGQMIYERMKAVRDEISVQFLPRFAAKAASTESEEEQNDRSEFADRKYEPPVSPSHPVIEDDEIPF